MLSLKKNITWSFIGNLVYSGCQWAILSVIAKTLGVEELGRYALAIAIVSPVFAFSNLSLRSVQATDVNEEYEFGEYFLFRVISSTSACFIVFFILYVSNYKMDVVYVVAGYVCVKMFESFSDVFYGLFQKNERMKYISISMMIRGVSNLLIFALTIVLTSNLIYGVLSLVLTTLLVLILSDVPNSWSLLVKRNYWRVSGLCRYLGSFKRLLIVSLPLGFTIFCNVMYQNIPKYIIDVNYGETLLGIYSGVAYLLIVGGVLINAVGQSSTPRLAKLFLSDKLAFNVLMKKLILLAISIGVLGVVLSLLVGDWILVKIYSKDFDGYAGLLTLIMFAGMISYISGVVGCALTAMRKFKSQAILSLISMLIVLISSPVLVVSFGIDGAVFSLILALTIKLVMESWFYHKFINDDPVC